MRRKEKRKPERCNERLSIRSSLLSYTVDDDDIENLYDRSSTSVSKKLRKDIKEKVEDATTETLEDVSESVSIELRRMQQTERPLRRTTK